MTTTGTATGGGRRPGSRSAGGRRTGARARQPAPGPVVRSRYPPVRPIPDNSVPGVRADRGRPASAPRGPAPGQVEEPRARQRPPVRVGQQRDQRAGRPCAGRSAGRAGRARPPSLPSASSTTVPAGYRPRASSVSAAYRSSRPRSASSRTSVRAARGSWAGRCGRGAHIAAYTSAAATSRASGGTSLARRPVG